MGTWRGSAIGGVARAAGILVFLPLMGLSGVGGIRHAGNGHAVDGAWAAPSPAFASPGVGQPRGGGLPRWEWPVAPPHRIVRPFEAPATRYSAGHRGIDVAAEAGTAVRAPAAGVVSFAGWVVNRPVLSIVHPGGFVSSVEPVDATVAVGDAVAADTPVGAVANTGSHCRAAPCLHLGVRLHGEYVSPLVLLGEVRRSVLLPLGGRTVFDE